MKNLLLVTPPFTQLNTPYPATAYLKGFLNTKEISSFQMDLGIEVILGLFTKNKLAQLFESAQQANTISSENAQRIYALKDNYLNTIEEVILFLQGKNATLARLICSGNFLPQAERFQQLDDLDWAFGSMGHQDKAKYLATSYIEDISDFIVECIDSNFGFSRYAEKLGVSAHSFNPLYEQLKAKHSVVDEIALELLDAKIKAVNPKLVCFSVPFPGNLFSAFRCAQFIKKNYPQIKIAMGGGFPNTELRSISDPRVFDFFDYITLDDGELPLELLALDILTQHSSNSEKSGFKRTFYRENGEVVFNNLTKRADYKQIDIGTPDYSDLLLDQYISVIELANPMHSLWCDGRWNKLTLAHGCYWAKCTFCDVSLDYIKLYEPVAASLIVDRIEQIIAQTGERGFHFVDEAAPPALMRELALELLRRKVTITWWTNIRFEKSFTADLCVLLNLSGCIAVSGGLEVASDRLLNLIDKGVTVEQVARVTDNFTQAGILVHAYLMYGYPSQTVQETIDSLEMVRQLFEFGIIQSGYWHQFALTAHSPIGKNPEKYSIKPLLKNSTFAKNDIEFEDETGIDHSQFNYGLKKALLNYMHGIGFEIPLKDWFNFKTPKTSIRPDYIENCLSTRNDFFADASSKVVWLGNDPFIEDSGKRNKKGIVHYNSLTFSSKIGTYFFELERDKTDWLLNLFGTINLSNKKLKTMVEIKKSYEQEFQDFELFWYSKSMLELRQFGLLTV